MTGVSDLAPGCEGQWSTIFGAWVNAIDAEYNSTRPINIVDCAVLFGNVTITQAGGASPKIHRDSFAKSSQTFMHLGAAETAWRRIYTSEATQSPYSFAAQQGGASGANTLYEDTLALLLLNYADGTGADAAEAASTIEANFDMGALFAFARTPHAASVTTRVDKTVNVWEYDTRFLAVLAIPMLAMVTVLWGRWRVGDAEDVVTYRPIDIARRGPVDHLVEDGEDGADEPSLGYDGVDDEKTLVCGVKWPESPTGGKPMVRIMTAGTF